MRVLERGSLGQLGEITDGLSNTMMVVEAGEEDAVPWMKPVDADEVLVVGLGPECEGSSCGGVNACFVDGSVHFLKVKTPVEVRRALSDEWWGDDFVGLVLRSD